MSRPPRSDCPCCSSTELQNIGKLPDSSWFAGARLSEPLPGGALYQCRQCFLKFRNPAETAAAYNQLYDNAATTVWSDGSTAAHRADWDQITGYVEKTAMPGARILDVGCYTGGLLQRLGMEYRRFGVEVNAAAAALASQQTEQPVWESVSSIPESDRFDFVIATDVVEHVINPLEFIEQLAAKLAEDGVLILTTGDADNCLWKRFGANWWYCFNPEHVAFISKRWLDYAAGAAGIEVVRCAKFRYANSSSATRAANRFFMHWYGWSPATFLGLVRFIKRFRGRPGVVSVPGVGVSKDHLFIVLSRR